MKTIASILRVAFTAYFRGVCLIGQTIVLAGLRFLRPTIAKVSDLTGWRTQRLAAILLVACATTNVAVRVVYGLGSPWIIVNLLLWVTVTGLGLSSVSVWLKDIENGANYMSQVVAELTTLVMYLVGWMAVFVIPVELFVMFYSEDGFEIARSFYRAAIGIFDILTVIVGWTFHIPKGKTVSEHVRERLSSFQLAPTKA